MAFPTIAQDHHETSLHFMDFVNWSACPDESSYQSSQLTSSGSFDEALFNQSVLFSNTSTQDEPRQKSVWDIMLQDEPLRIPVENTQVRACGDLFTIPPSYNESPLSYISSGSSASSYLPSDEFSPQQHSITDTLEDVFNENYLKMDAMYPPLSPILSFDQFLITKPQSSVVSGFAHPSPVAAHDTCTSGSSDAPSPALCTPSPPPLPEVAASLPVEQSLSTEKSIPAFSFIKPFPLPPSALVTAKPTPAPGKSPFLRRSARAYKSRRGYVVDGLTQSDDDDDDDEYLEDSNISVGQKRSRDLSNGYSSSENNDEYEEDDDESSEPSPKKTRTSSSSSTKPKRPYKPSRPKGATKKFPCFLGCGLQFTRKADNRRHCLSSLTHKSERDQKRCEELFDFTELNNRCKLCGENLSRKDARRRHEKKVSCGKRTSRGKGDNVEED